MSSIVGADADDAGEILIDVSAYAASEQVNAAIKAMSNHTTANFTIAAVNAASSSGLIWIDQTDESLPANNFYTELEDLTSLISANRGGKAGGLKVTMDASTPQDGDAVRIHGQTYQFVSRADQAVITDDKEIVLQSIADGLTNGEPCCEAFHHTQRRRVAYAVFFYSLLLLKLNFRHLTAPVPLKNEKIIFLSTFGK